MEPLRSSTSRAATSCVSLGGAAGGSGSGTDVTPRYCDGREGRALIALPTLRGYTGHIRSDQGVKRHIWRTAGPA